MHKWLPNLVAKFWLPNLVLYQTAHCGSPPAWLICGHTQLNSYHFLAFDWSSSFYAFCTLHIGFSSEFGGQTHYGPLFAFGHVLLNSSSFMSSDLSNILHICRQITYLISWNLVDRLMWLSRSDFLFSHPLLYSHCFLTSDWLSNFCALADKQLIRFCSIWWTDSIWNFLGLPNFGHTSLNSCRFLAFDRLSSFCIFAHKLLIRLSSSLVDELVGLPRPE